VVGTTEHECGVEPDRIVFACTMGIGMNASGGTKGGCLSQSPFRVRYRLFSGPVLQV